jgi:hypothetical protein
MLSIEMWYRTYIDSPSEAVAPAMHTANEQSPVND